MPIRRVDKERGTLLKMRERDKSDERHYSLGGQHSFEREILREQSTMMCGTQAVDNLRGGRQHDI